MLYSLLRVFWCSNCHSVVCLNVETWSAATSTVKWWRLLLMSDLLHVVKPAKDENFKRWKAHTSLLLHGSWTNTDPRCQQVLWCQWDGVSLGPVNISLGTNHFHDPRFSYSPHRSTHGGKICSHCTVMWGTRYLPHLRAKENNLQIIQTSIMTAELHDVLVQLFDSSHFMARLWSHKACPLKRRQPLCGIQLICFSSTWCSNQIKL